MGRLLTKPFSCAFNAVAWLLLDALRVTRALNLRNYIRLAYHLVLRRPPDAAGLAHYRRQILEKRLPAAWIFEALTRSPEYRKLANPMHYARLQLVRRLPAADTIVDLGGSSPDADEGALYLMEYPHAWKRLVVVDLPPAERFDEWRKPAERGRVETPKGPVEYVYGSAADPGVLAEASFADLVWSGNMIEHVSEAEGDGLIRLAFRALKPGGWFCLDTPNRRVTQKLCGDCFCNPDHKIEYTHEALAAKLRRGGFEIVEQLGVLDCRSIRPGREPDARALAACPDFAERVEDGYFLYYRCRKP